MDVTPQDGDKQLGVWQRARAWFKALPVRFPHGAWRTWQVLQAVLVGFVSSPRWAWISASAALLTAAFGAYIGYLNLTQQDGAKAKIMEWISATPSLAYVVASIIALGVIKPLVDLVSAVIEGRKSNDEKDGLQTMQWIITRSVMLDRDLTPKILDCLSKEQNVLKEVAKAVAESIFGVFEKFVGDGHIRVHIVQFSPSSEETPSTDVHRSLNPQVVASYGGVVTVLSDASAAIAAQSCISFSGDTIRPHVRVFENLSYELLRPVKKRAALAENPSYGSQIVLPVDDGNEGIPFAVVITADKQWLFRAAQIEFYRQIGQLLTGPLPLAANLGSVKLSQQTLEELGTIREQLANAAPPEPEVPSMNLEEQV